MGGTEERHDGVATTTGKRFLSSVLPSGSQVRGRVDSGMNRTHASEFILFDGAIVPMDRITSIIRDGYPGCCLYEDLGDEARRVSPWLLSLPSPAEDLAVEMSGSRITAHGVNRLSAQTSIRTVALHLKRLQAVFADNKPYYLRYADGRSLADLWEVLNPIQRAILLGPVKAWESCPADTPSRYIAARDNHELSPDKMLPLRLSTEQFCRLMRAQRDTQRWTTWLKMQPALVAGYTLEELRYLSKRTGAWLRVREDALPPRLVHAVGVAALRSKGEVFEHPGFADAVRHGVESGDRRPIDSWLQQNKTFGDVDDSDHV